ncbi:MAG: hypothetical protein ACD_39C00821G0004 [uncultured bacterium]|nr:MAG: hypothetical protein ACD_39C00821G0004 [uncultured bacterium]
MKLSPSTRLLRAVGFLITRTDASKIGSSFGPTTLPNTGTPGTMAIFICRSRSEGIRTSIAFGEPITGTA